MTFSIVPPHLAVEAMRDNGYKTGAFALAELMDNSIQAGAKNVELLCLEDAVVINGKSADRIAQVAVLDDACGMDKSVLQIALQFGNGTRLETENHTGIGRFGMGLPASSISQCKRVEVWSWQEGIENAIYSYLDLNEIKDQVMSLVPEPTPKDLPNVWRSVGKNFSKSGTLVVWSKLDRLDWRTAKAVINNSEFIIGRMYRKFIASGKTQIRMASYVMDDLKKAKIDQLAKPNDPGYLMTNTSTPEPWTESPMFEEWADDGVSIHKVNYRGEDHEVSIKYSHAKKSAREGVNPGSKDHGKHAARNLGLSVVRAGRELELDDGFTDPSDPRDRWWGIEIEFPPALDEVFGVTNNKQHANKLSEMCKINMNQLLELEDVNSITELKEQLEEEDDPKAVLVEIVNQMQSRRATIRNLLKAQTKNENNDGAQRHPKQTPEGQATELTDKRKKDGYEGSSDADEALSKEEKMKDIVGDLVVNAGLDLGKAREAAAATVDNGQKYLFVEADLETPSFFSVRQKGGSIIIALNTNHPAYENLVEVLGQDTKDASEPDLRDRLQKASDGLKLLLMAWARYEDEQPDGPRRTSAQGARLDWGRVAQQFLSIE
jgi:hypothetical protein